MLLATGAGLMVAHETEAADATRVAFGMDAASIGKQTAAGVRPDYGTIWVGPWTLNGGWSGVDAALRSMRSAGVTPAIHFYYWGGDISRDCLENGCWSHVHQTWKDKWGWDRLARGLSDRLNSAMAGKPVLIFLETEFNNNDVQTYEALDGYLKAKVDHFHNTYAHAHVVMSLGNWNTGNWWVWDRTAAASDYVGIQGMRGSTRDSWSAYHGLYDAVLAGAKKARTLYGKPLIVQDIGLSSYPDASHRQAQADVLQKFFTGLPALKSVGVKALLYRAWADDPNGNLREYYREGERHWGLTYAWGGHKPAAKVWVEGVAAERGAAGTRTGATTPTTATAATITPTPNVNPWWVEAKVAASATPSRVEARDGTGGWVALAKTAWGTWAKSFHVPAGTPVTFRATFPSGAVATSPTLPWLQDTTTTTLSATFDPRSEDNNWWVETAVKSSSAIQQVAASVNGGGWTNLPRTAWGTWAKSFHVPDGAAVTFRATDGAGQVVTSKAYTWGDTGTAPWHATFQPRSVGNDWWVETAVQASGPLKTVQARIDGGTWTTLPATGWGTYAKSIHAPNGALVTFRALDAGGATVTSLTYVW